MSLTFMPVQTCRVEVSQKGCIHTKFCSHSPRNCWNFWDIRSWALPTALRTFPSTEERTKTQFVAIVLRLFISEASCYSSYGRHTNTGFSAIVRKYGVHTKTCLHEKSTATASTTSSALWLTCVTLVWCKPKGVYTFRCALQCTAQPALQGGMEGITVYWTMLSSLKGI